MTLGPAKPVAKGPAGTLRIEQAAEEAERGVENEHRLERAQARHAGRHQQVRTAHHQCAGGGSEGADQAIASEHPCALDGWRSEGEDGMLDGHENADAAGGRIEGAYR